MTNYLKQRLEAAALKAEQQEDQEYWDREYSGDIELGRAKLEIKELKQKLDAHNHLKSITTEIKSVSWNLNRIANVLEEVVPNNKTAGERILNSIRRGGK